MFSQSLTAKSILLNACLAMLALGPVSASAHVLAKAQEPSDRQRALELYEAQNFIGAVPLLEKIAAANPNDISILSRRGFSLYESSAIEKAPAARRKMLEKARTVL